MELGTTITGIVIILIFTVPLILMRINNSKKERKLVQGLFDFAEKNNCQITRHDLWDDNLIGIDDSKNILFFKRKVNDSEISKQVDLAEVQKSRVMNNSRPVSNKEGNYNVTDQVELVLTYYDKNKKETWLEFYNANYDSLMLKGELQLAEK